MNKVSYGGIIVQFVLSFESSYLLLFILSSKYCSSKAERNIIKYSLMIHILLSISLRILTFFEKNVSEGTPVSSLHSCVRFL